jgi:hypothetical protein
MSKAFPFLYPIIFLLVLLGGYISILSGASWEAPKKKSSTKSKSKEKVSWDDVGNEFKEMLYDAFHSARESIKDNKK